MELSRVLIQHGFEDLHAVSIQFSSTETTLNLSRTFVSSVLLLSTTALLVLYIPKS